MADTVRTEAELRWVPDSMPPQHVWKLRTLPSSEMSDDDITRLYQKLAQEYVS